MNSCLSVVFTKDLHFTLNVVCFFVFFSEDHELESVCHVVHRVKRFAQHH